MPELPEVETVANGVHERVHGQTIRSVWTSNKPQTFKSSPDEIIETLTGSRIDRVHRVGKTIVVDLSRKKKPAQFLVHLGMTGRLLVSTPDTPVPPHTHAILTLSSGKELRFVDPRRFGRLSVVAPDTKYEGPGAEPLTIPLEDFIILFRNRKTPIKAALLNQGAEGVHDVAEAEMYPSGSIVVELTEEAQDASKMDLARVEQKIDDLAAAVARLRPAP